MNFSQKIRNLFCFQQKRDQGLLPGLKKDSCRKHSANQGLAFNQLRQIRNLFGLRKSYHKQKKNIIVIKSLTRSCRICKTCFFGLLLVHPNRKVLIWMNFCVFWKHSSAMMNLVFSDKRMIELNSGYYIETSKKLCFFRKCLLNEYTKS